MKYKFLASDVVAKIDDDGLCRVTCSIDDANYMRWLANGNTPDPADPESIIVPQEVSKAQGIAALIEAKLWNSVKKYFKQDATEDDRDLFDAVTVFNRNSPLLLKLQALLQLTDEQVDQLFINASGKVV